MGRRKYSTEFKIESASLVLDKDYTMADACAAVCVGETAMRRWVKQLQDEHQGGTPNGGKALTLEQQKIQELEAKIKRIEREKENLKNGYRALDVRYDEVISIMNHLRAQYRQSELLSAFDVPRSSYNYHRRRVSRPCEERERIKVKMKAIHQASRGSAGSRTITRQLRGLDETIGRYRVRSLMKEAGLVSTQYKQHRYRLADTESVIAPNRLDRQFNVIQPNQVWCGDITYVWCGDHWLYLAVVLDLCKKA